MVTRLNKLSLAISAILATSQLAYAQNNELEKTVVKDEKPATLDGVVIDSIDIQQQGMNTGTDLIRHTPGVQMSDNGDRYNDNGFNIRGVEGDDIAITVDGLELGETLNPPTFLPYGMFGSNRGLIDLETVKSVQITKGPDSVLSGSGALGGSVSLTTKDPEDFLKDGEAFGGKVKLGFDDRTQETLVSTAFAARYAKTEALLMVVQRDGSETQAHGDGEDVLGPDRGQADPFDHEQISVLAKLNFQINDNQRIGLVVEDSGRDTDGTPFSRDSDAYYNFTTEDESTRSRYGVFYELNNAELIAFDTLSVSLDTQEIYNSGITQFSFDAGAFRGAPDRSDDILRIEDRSYDQETLDLKVDFEKTLGANDLVYGIAYRTSEVANELYDRRFATVDPNSEQTQDVRDPSWVPNTEKTVFSLYLLDTFRVNDALTLSAGLRYEDTDYTPTVDENFVDPLGVALTDSSFSGFAGQVTADYEFIKGHSLGLNLAQAYKAPTTQQLYLDVAAEEDGFTDITTGETFDDWERITNSDLDAETAQSIELSYTWKTDVSFLKVNVFNTDYSDRIESTQFTRDLGQTIEVEGVEGNFSVDTYTQAQNTGEQNVTGYELESRYNFTDAITLSFSYSHIEGEHKSSQEFLYNEGDELITVSPDSATLGLSYVAPEYRWGAQAFLVWTDAKDESSDLSFTSLNNGNGPLQFPDAYTVLDIGAFYNVTDSLSVYANIHNLTDENYIRWEVINNVREGDGGFFGGATELGAARFSEPGRSFSLSAAYTF